MRKNSTVSMMLLGVLLSMFALPVFAQSGQDIGGAADNVFTQLSSLADVITAGVFLAGLGIAAASAFKFKAHSDNPQQVTLKVPLMYAFVAALCIGLPAYLNMSRSTIFEGEQGNSMDKGVYQNVQ